MGEGLTRPKDQRQIVDPTPSSGIVVNRLEVDGDVVCEEEVHPVLTAAVSRRIHMG